MIFETLAHLYLCVCALSSFPRNVLGAFSRYFRNRFSPSFFGVLSDACRLDFNPVFDVGPVGLSFDDLPDGPKDFLSSDSRSFRFLELLVVGVDVVSDAARAKKASARSFNAD